jgi:hypothetical protein
MAKQAPLTRADVRSAIAKVAATTPICDIHTHLYDPVFGSLLLWGIDELLTYHYLVAEVFRYHSLPYEKFWQMSKTEQADLIWKLLFLDNSPVSESCRGVLTTLNRLGLDAKQRDLPAIRKWFAKWKTEKYVDLVFETANIRTAVMTNNPFDDLERPLWLKGWNRDGRFKAALRVDEALMQWEKTVGTLREWGYELNADMNDKTVSEARRFFADWTTRMKPLYCMVSLPPSFRYPDSSLRTAIIDRVIVPHCREHGMPFALMIGVNKLINPQLKLAGDGVGRADVDAVRNLCAQYPDNKFLVTMLSRENQHELCVVARKFRNLMVFGCWWFMNNPSIIEEITRERMELLGMSFIPQHSDARVLDQVIYKWDHSRRIIADVLVDKYSDLLDTGWVLTRGEIERDVRNLFSANFERFIK